MRVFLASRLTALWALNDCFGSGTGKIWVEGLGQRHSVKGGSCRLLEEKLKMSLSQLDCGSEAQSIKGTKETLRNHFTKQLIPDFSVG